MDRRTRYSPEVRERATRLVWERRGAHASQWQALRAIADKVGRTAELLRRWVRLAERDTGQRIGRRI